MKRNKRVLVIGMCALLLVALMPAFALFAGEMTIQGKVSEEGIVADDGQVYVVADSEKGTELMGHANKRVRITGTVEEREGKRVLTVTGFKLVKSSPVTGEAQN